MKKKIAIHVIIGLMLIITIIAMIPVQYQAKGIFVQCLDSRTYMILSDGTHYARTTCPKDTDDVINDDILQNYDTIDLGNYDTNEFMTGDMITLTRDSNVMRQLTHTIWLYTHARIYKVETTTNFTPSDEKFGLGFNIPIQPAIKPNNGTLTRIGQLTEEQIKKLDNKASQISTKSYIGSYHYDTTGHMPEIISPNDILWQ